MTEQELSKLVQDKIFEERKQLPVHQHIDLAIVTNGRGATDAGELYNKVLDDTLAIVQKSTTAILKEVLESKGLLDK
jgi:hypothetical protein